jgi:ferritin-like metal-binding protein YciE
MAKTKKADAPKAKENASYSEKNKATPKPSKANSAKFEPTEDADMSIALLDPKDGLQKLFCDSIKDIYWAENQLVKALPKMASAASVPELKDAILSHLNETRMQVTRLEKVFELLSKKPQAKKCDAMEGLTKEGEGVIEDTDKASPARNLGIIMASQKVEHYEISAYTGLIKLAQKLGLPEEIATLLSESLSEEEAADETLGGIADSSIDFYEEGEEA